MDEDMWRHPATRANLEKIRGYGTAVIPVEKGELASGLYGDGRMAEPEAILQFVREISRGAGGEARGASRRGRKARERRTQGWQSAEWRRGTIVQDLAGKRALVTAGPTYEAIDPVRFIGNHSSGKMGLAIARELAQRGAEVDLVLGPSLLECGDHPGVTVTAGGVGRADVRGLYRAVGLRPDIGVMAAAAADYFPAAAPLGKDQEDREDDPGDDKLNLELSKTKDILKTLGQQKRKGQVLAGFALETTDGREYALGKLKSKQRGSHRR